MVNSIDYLTWRGDLSFEHAPINEIDMFLCSQLSTPEYNGIIKPTDNPVMLKQVANKYFLKHKKDDSLGKLQSPSVLPMLEKMGNTVRYGKDISLAHWVQEINKNKTEQFSAVTIVFPDNSVCVSYRGTDDTLIGWKEDCELATTKAVAAQQDALRYLTSIAEHYNGTIRICGHSKGGNLAISAACSASSEIQDRIECVYNFDGPGFKKEFLSSPGYLAVKDRIFTILSQHSIVGLLMEQVGHIEIVQSNVTGMYAHDGFNWEVLGTEFVKCKKLSSISQTFKKAMDKTLKKLNEEDKRGFIEELFEILMSKGSFTITEFTNLKKTDIAKIVYDITHGEKVKKFGTILMKELSNQVIDNTEKDLSERISNLLGK